jgi:predicted amidohydrolase YtcJ
VSIVLTNANVYTSNDKMPWANTVVIDGERIAYIGDNDKAKWEKAAGTKPEIFNMHDKMIIPGFIDSHVHPGMVSASSWHIRLPLTKDVNELLAFVKKYAEEHSASEIPFLYFEYYDTTLFDEKGPRKEQLDSVVSDRPCLMQDFGDHMCWVNSKMLEYLEVDKNTPDPIPGLRMFVRDPDGEPTGFIKEMAWRSFAENIYKRIKWEPPTFTPESLKPFFTFLTDNGVTAMADGITDGEQQIKSISQLDKAGKLNVYFDGVSRFENISDLPEKIEQAKEWQKKYGSKHIKINTIKAMLDGTNESGNCSVVEPFVNDPTGKNHGTLKMEETDFVKCLVLCNKAGMDMTVHLVGDGAFRTACNAYEKAKSKATEPWKMQLILLHCELVHPDDMRRPGKLGITINWTCHWSGGYFGEQAKLFFGEERWNSMYQFNPMINNGALVAFSSDVVTFYELNRANPFFGMQVAHTRVDPEFPLDPERYPGSMRLPESAKLSREVLMKGYTINGAKQMRWDDRMGSIEVGKLANLNVISDNFVGVGADKIKDIKFDAVMFEGKVLRGQL